MIFVFHKNNKVVKVTQNYLEISFEKMEVVNALFLLAKKHKKEHIVWCHIDFEPDLNYNFIAALSLSNPTILSYNPYLNNYLNSKLGYIDQNSILKVNKKVRFQTWQMHESVGIISSDLLLKIEKHDTDTTNFNYFLNAIANRTFMNGVLCYSEPQLLNNLALNTSASSTDKELFKFVKQHYNLKWFFLLFFSVFLFERKILLLPFLQALFYKRKPIIKEDFISEVFEKNVTISNCSIDVVIPTIGRASYLKDFLVDLKQQEVLPNSVIIVEQNPNVTAESELSYLSNETWPFKIIHQFISQTGACHARNLALQEISSEWVFFSDDDIRIAPDFLKKAVQKIKCLEANAVLFSCLLKNQKATFLLPHQTAVFGSGCTMVKAEFASKINFDTKYEFCFGEDTDYGMKLKHLGTDVIYLPQPEILHIKAPIGGFRTPPKYLWSEAVIQPKPSPTILLNLLRYATPEQQKGYKMVYFMKSLNWKQPIQSIKENQAHWKSSLFWANKLENM
ncbi:glycosyltransferase family 2 protein [Flavobacterium difficile]|uniref:Glycosyltransferase family 2 protein n=1 Tax=Flavobacterium difficile TaxID=2709659 RepID=A0ABX0I6I7_9FLAO|nr:glycosyltransferase family A protein [Flavobacterium difficile]NHM01135.1 glycosyltransferase family 2 protein [Flavobacterium difficile]